MRYFVYATLKALNSNYCQTFRNWKMFTLEFFLVSANIITYGIPCYLVNFIIIGLDQPLFLSALPILCYLSRSSWLISVFTSTLKVLIVTSSLFSPFVSFSLWGSRQFGWKYCSKSYSILSSGFQIFSKEFQ